jgi:hypothetical protein
MHASDANSDWYQRYLVVLEIDMSFEDNMFESFFNTTNHIFTELFRSLKQATTHEEKYVQSSFGIFWLQLQQHVTALAGTL